MSQGSPAAAPPSGGHPSPPSQVFCERAWLGPGQLERDVTVTVDGGRIASVQTGMQPPAAAVRLEGLLLPGFANAHSHAFHRSMRGRSHRSGGSFWSWRDTMYELAATLDPDRYHTLARAVFAEMVSAGFTTVGEFHYLHHDRDGRAYAAPNQMADALIAAAREAGIRLTLLDTCYLAGGIEQPLSAVQRRFSDGDADAWAARVESLASDYAGATDITIGAAVHSIRAVPVGQLPTIAAWSLDRQVPIHAHVSEQPRENEECLARYGRSPTQLLADHGLVGPRTTAVHATHLTQADLTLLGSAGSFACLCPTTERDLADGIGPAADLAAAGAQLTIGSDSHAVIDAFEETRAIELNLRLRTGVRGNLSTERLLTAATATGHASLGVPDAGRIAVGARADLVAVDTDSVRCAGVRDEDVVDCVVFAASSCDVTDVLIDGRWIVRNRAHRLGPVGPLLTRAIGELEVHR